MTQADPEKNTVLTLAIKPRSRDAIKPAELIQVSGHHELTLNARRAITVLWYTAHTQGVAEGRDYTIEIDDLKPDGHKGYEMVEEAIEALMRTILTLKLPDGKTRRVQFLGGNDLDDPDRPAGVLTYSFDKRLIDVLKDFDHLGQDRSAGADGLQLEIRRQPLRKSRAVFQPDQEDLSRLYPR